MLTAPWERLVVDGWSKNESSGTQSCVFSVLAHHHLCVCACVWKWIRDSKVPLSLIFDSLAQPLLCPPSKASVKQSSLSSVKPTSTQQLWLWINRYSAARICHTHVKQLCTSYVQNHIKKQWGKHGTAFKVRLVFTLLHAAQHHSEGVLQKNTGICSKSKSMTQCACKWSTLSEWVCWKSHKPQGDA